IIDFRDGGQEPPGRDDRAKAMSNRRKTMKTTSSTNLIASVAIVGALVAGFATGPAFAQAPFEFKFNYGAHELTTAPAAEKLLVRLEREVRAYCGGSTKMSIQQRNLVDECVSITMKESINKFDSPTVAQAFSAHA